MKEKYVLLATLRVGVNNWAKKREQGGEICSTGSYFWVKICKSNQYLEIGKTLTSVEMLDIGQCPTWNEILRVKDARRRTKTT